MMGFLSFVADVLVSVAKEAAGKMAVAVTVH